MQPFAFSLSTANAQETVPATGGNASGTGGSVSYSVGQIVYTTSTGTIGSAAQGVQQPYEISVVTGIEETQAITLQCSVCPNPASDFLILKIHGAETIKYPSLQASLYDMTGKLLETKQICSNETTISMRNRAQATYFLKVTENSKRVKTFKIIKN